MRSLRTLAAGVLLLWVAGVYVGAQQPTTTTPTLDEVLTRVHENFITYLNTIPNIFADEHIASVMSATDYNSTRAGMSSTIDSEFRLERSDDPAKHLLLIESRQVVALNHHPATDDAILHAPNMVTGAFSYAAAFFSTALEPCYDYKLETNQKLKKKPVLVVRYSLKHDIPASAKCPVREPISGRAFIDPATMQIIRLEQKRPEYLLRSVGQAVGGKTQESPSTETSALPPGRAGIPVLSNSPTNIFEIAPGTVGTWVWSIDYAPVVIDNQTFWLPKTIVSTVTTNTGRSMNWSFTGSYKNYHLLTVTTEILPGYKLATKK